MKQFIPLVLWGSCACLVSCRPSFQSPDQQLGSLQRSLQASDADLKPTQQWLDRECSDVAEAHEFLVRHWMVDWVIGSRTFSGKSILDYEEHPDWLPPAFTVAALLQLLWDCASRAVMLGKHKNGRTVVPAIFHFDGEVRLHPSISQSWNISQKAYQDVTTGGIGYDYLPNFKDVAAVAPLPNFIFATSPHDGMTSSHLMSPFPWVTKCQVDGQESSLMLPIKINSTRYFGNADHPRAGPGDTRDKRAVFLGSDSGPVLGRRRAVVRLGRTRSNELYAKLTSLGDDIKDTYANDTAPHMSMKEQIDKFSKVVYVGGNCASLRMDALLNSDALTLMVLESLPLWYFPILVPFRHFVPIIYEPRQFTDQEGLNWGRAWGWAESHPEAVAEVVKEANKFAQLHLTKKGKTCYMARAMLHYAKLMTDRGKVKQLWEQTLKEFPFEDQYRHLIENEP